MRGVTTLLLLTVALPCLADAKEELFGTGKPPTFREEALDKKFARSKFAKMLKSGTNDPACVQLLGGLFVALAEVAPKFHKRDETFSLEPALVEAVNAQLSTPQFPAMAYLVSMVRRVLIDSRLPDEWLATAQALNRSVKIIDLAKLKMINEQVQPVDSAWFSIPVLRERYLVDALGANSAVTAEAVQGFKDTYLDRDVAWGGAQLVDVGVNQPKGGKKRRFAAAEPEELVAVLRWVPPEAQKAELDLLSKARTAVEPVILYARLQPRQYADLETFHKNDRVLVKGRFWEMNRGATELEVREAVLFHDPDWAQGTLLGNPADIARCPVAINELTGLAPQQPGGFRH